jgi:hypothetical protein
MTHLGGICRTLWACAIIGAVVGPMLLATAHILVNDCDAWFRAAEFCLRETQQLTPAKREALQSARSQFTALSGGEDGSGPRQRLAAQCREMS